MLKPSVLNHRSDLQSSLGAHLVSTSLYFVSFNLCSPSQQRVCEAIQGVCVWVWESVCQGQVSLSLVTLAEGLCSHLNPPPALPATAAQWRSVCFYVTVCVSFKSCRAVAPGEARQQCWQAEGSRPPSGFPLSGTSCVCGQQLLLPSMHSQIYCKSSPLFYSTGSFLVLYVCDWDP